MGSFAAAPSAAAAVGATILFCAANGLASCIVAAGATLVTVVTGEAVTVAVRVIDVTVVGAIVVEDVAAEADVAVGSIVGAARVTPPIPEALATLNSPAAGAGGDTGRPVPTAAAAAAVAIAATAAAATGDAVLAANAEVSGFTSDAALVAVVVMVIVLPMLDGLAVLCLCSHSCLYNSSLRPLYL